MSPVPIIQDITPTRIILGIWRSSRRCVLVVVRKLEKFSESTGFDGIVDDIVGLMMPRYIGEVDAPGEGAEPVE